jgi:hypothetical protein
MKKLMDWQEKTKTGVEIEEKTRTINQGKYYRRFA